MKKWLFNPFMLIAGSSALVTGMAAMLASAVICYYSKTHFDGVIDAHTGLTAPIYVYLIEPLVDWVLIVLMLYIAGKLFSDSTVRFIDVAGTQALARWVMIFSAIIGFFITVPDTGHSVDDLVRSITPLTIMLGLLEIVFAIWMIALMYNAFKISCNLKGGKATSLFIAGLLIAEILSKFTLNQFFKHLI